MERMHFHYFQINHQMGEPFDSQNFQTPQRKATMTEKVGPFQSQKSLPSTAPALNCCYYFQISHQTELLNSQIILLLLVMAVLFQTLHQMAAMCQILHCQAVICLVCSHYLQILAVMTDQADSHHSPVVLGLIHFHHFRLQNCHFQ